MKLLLCSDSHGPVDPRILDLARGCDAVVHAGDVGGADTLRALADAAPATVVRGNNDVPGKWAETDVDTLATLPEVAELALPGGRLVVVHGDRHLPAARRHERLRTAFPDARAILYGHSHRLCVDDAAHPWVLNPGACGRARTFGGPSCLLLSAGRRWRLEVCRFERA